MFKQRGDVKTHFCEDYWALTWLAREKESFTLIQSQSNLTGNMLCQVVVFSLQAGEVL